MVNGEIQRSIREERVRAEEVVQENDPSARTAHAPHLLRHLDRIRDHADQVRGVDDVERGVGEFEVGGVHLEEPLSFCIRAARSRAFSSIDAV